ncbi:hypothetical protein BX600DRAFT_489822 [Xylariales sp. PMI_506]|nr:hypothetical protein BX600DRAFT_489822 [Xylariales sp. PMI_506]
MTTLNNVAVLGKGNLGSAVVEQLAKQGFTVTVVSRNPDSLGVLPAGVTAVQVDYESAESLVNALRGHDAVICTLNGTAAKDHRPIIDAAIQAGVKRFVPSVFGSFPTDPKAHQALKFTIPYADTQKYLIEKAEDGVLEYTIFSVGAFLDLVFVYPILLDWKNRSAQLFDGGKQPVSMSSLTTVGKTIAAALLRPEVSRNRNLFVHDTSISQIKLLEMAKKHSKGEWTEINVDGDSEYQRALVAAEGADIFDPSASFPLVVAALLTGKFNSAYKSVDNEILGLELLNDEELEAKIAAVVG